METIALSESGMILQTYGTSQQVSNEKVWGSVTNTVSDITRLIDSHINTQYFNVIVYVSKSKANAKNMFTNVHMSDEMKNILRRSGPKQYLSFLQRMSYKEIIVKEENSKVLEEDAQVMVKNAETIGRKWKTEMQIIKEENNSEEKEEILHEVVRDLTEKINSPVIKQYNLRPKLNNFVLPPIKREASIEGTNKTKRKTKRKVSIPVGKFVRRKIRSSFSIAKSRLRLVKS